MSSHPHVWPSPRLTQAQRQASRATSTQADRITRACQDPDIQRWTRVPVPYRRPDAEAFIATWAGSLLVRAVVDAATDDGLAMDDVVSASLDISIHNPASQAVAHAAGFVPGKTPDGLTVPDRGSNSDGESAALRFVRTLHR